MGNTKFREAGYLFREAGCYINQRGRLAGRQAKPAGVLVYYDEVTSLLLRRRVAIFTLVDEVTNLVPCYEATICCLVREYIYL